MEKVDAWPPPNWTEVVILWEKLLKDHTYYPMMDWIDNTPGGRYHVHGYKSTKGFAFRFEQAEDATHFKLRWS